LRICQLVGHINHAESGDIQKEHRSRAIAQPPPQFLYPKPVHFRPILVFVSFRHGVGDPAKALFYPGRAGSTPKRLSFCPDEAGVGRQKRFYHPTEPAVSRQKRFYDPAEPAAARNDCRFARPPRRQGGKSAFFTRPSRRLPETTVVLPGHHGGRAVKALFSPGRAGGLPKRRSVLPEKCRRPVGNHSFPVGCNCSPISPAPCSQFLTPHS